MVVNVIDTNAVLHLGFFHATQSDTKTNIVSWLLRIIEDCPHKVQNNVQTLAKILKTQMIS